MTEMTYCEEFYRMLASLEGPDREYFFNDPQFWDILEILEDDIVVSSRWDALDDKYGYE